MNYRSPPTLVDANESSQSQTPENDQLYKPDANLISSIVEISSFRDERRTVAEREAEEKRQQQLEIEKKRLADERRMQSHKVEEKKKKKKKDLFDVFVLLDCGRSDSTGENERKRGR